MPVYELLPDQLETLRRTGSNGRGFDSSHDHQDLCRQSPKGDFLNKCPQVTMRFRSMGHPQIAQ